jgi:hypothetical protein
MRLPVPLSVQLAEFHRSHVAYHRRMARRHARHGHHGAAALRHLRAAEAHEAAAAALDKRLPGAAMRASAMADEASQRVGVASDRIDRTGPLLPWPKR